MMMRATILSACLATAAALSPNPATVAELNVTAYAGTWYQVYGDAAVMKTFERDNVCVTAQYGLNADGTISVVNDARLVTPTGQDTVITGSASIPDADKPGQLLVKLDGQGAAPYWVLDLGPVNGDGLYDWAIVSDNLSATLFVLARDPDDFAEKYDADVSNELVDLGFTGFSEPLAVYQGDDCTYPSKK